MTQPVVWTIAGSDACGGAGLQTDLRTFHNFDVHGCTVITAVTAQNPAQFGSSVTMPISMLQAQAALLPHPAAIKIGMIADVSILRWILELLTTLKTFVVFDPVLISSSGAKLYQGDMNIYLQELQRLLPLVDLITPNKYEAEMILQCRIENYNDVERAARDLLKLGAKQVLMKGGHFIEELSQDFWTDGESSCWLASKRYLNRQCHGTGCVTSAAIAAAYARGYPITDALVLAKMYVNRGIRLSVENSIASYFQHELGLPDDEVDLPYISYQPLSALPKTFDRADQYQIGLYPVVDTVEWMQKLLPLGIKHIQLRIKDKNDKDLAAEIQLAIQLARDYNAKLYINDHWELALKHGAYGVHLGQEDLQMADVPALQQAGMRLGISTHCYYEVARAHAFAPSYMACGPVYHTNSKAMAFAPQGVAALKQWRKLLSYPLVAIGGINQNNIASVAAQKMNGIAMISAITQAEHYETATQALMNQVKAYAE